MSLWRWVVCVCLLSLAVVSGEALADLPPNTCNSTAQQCSEATARALCASYESAAVDQLASRFPGQGTPQALGCPLQTSTSVRAYARIAGVADYETYMWWDPSVTGPQPNRCASVPAISGAQSWTGGGGATCSGGCRYESAGSSITLGTGSRAKTYADGSGLVPTGAACTATDAALDPTPVKEDCAPVAGQTLCSKPNGQVCATASTGKQLCWSPGETGTKTSGDTSITVQAGSQHTQPNLQIPNGDTLVKQGETTTVTTTTTTAGGGTKTITTNITTYTTQNGTNPGKEGEEDGDVPTAATGAGCDQGSFQCSDMSSVECNQLIQTWYLRCKGVDLNGGANCDAPPSCTGNASDCYIGRMLWNYRCDGKDEAAAGQPTSGFDGQVAAEGDGKDLPDVSKIGTGDTADASLSMWQEKNINAELDKLNAGGFLNGSDQCPQLPPFTVGTSSFTLSMAPICSILRNVGIMVLALSYWLAIRILAKSR